MELKTVEDMLEFLQTLLSNHSVELDLSGLDIQEDVVVIPAERLIDGLLSCARQNEGCLLETIPAGLQVGGRMGSGLLNIALPDGAWDGDDSGPVVDANVVHVSDRNNDPVYREARENLDRMRERQDVVRQPDGPVIKIPVKHRAELDDETRALHEKIGVLNDQYMARSGSIICVNFPAYLDATIPGGLTITEAGWLPPPVLLLYLAIIAYSPQAVASPEGGAMLKKLEDVTAQAFAELPDALQKLVTDGRFLSEDVGICNPQVVGVVDDDDPEVGADNPEREAWLVAWPLPDQLITIIVQ
jgi:hypothetical protein